MHTCTVALPISDESFTSWVHRLPATTPAQYDLISEFKQLQFAHPGSLDSFDPDFELTDMFWHSISVTFPIDGLNLKVFRPEALWIIPHNKSDYACRSCVAESLRQIHRIALYKKWRYVVAPICLVHREFLIDYGWRRDGNLNFLSAPSLRLRDDLSDRSVGVIIDMAMPIQSMMLKLENKARSVHPLDLNYLTAEYQARKTLMEFFLIANYAKNGIATQSITEPKQPNSMLRAHGFKLLAQIGALEASAPERACALIMMGVVSGYLSKQKVALLNKDAVTEHGIKNWDAIELGSACHDTLGSDIRVALRHIESALAFFKTHNSNLFMKGLKPWV